MLSVFNVSFRIFEIFGCWLPTNFPSRWTHLYHCGTGLYLFSIFFMLMTQVLDLVLVKQSLASFIACCPLIFASANGCVKSINIIWRRREIVQVIDMLSNDICRPRGWVEERIKGRADRKCRLITYLCITLTSLIMAGLSIGTMITGVFPIHTRFLPRPLESGETFWPFVVIWSIIGTAMSTVLVACNALIAGLMIQICAQLDFLKYRLCAELTGKSEFTGETDHIRLCIRHHLFIFEIGKCIQRIFAPALYVQMSITIGNFATSVFQMMLTDVQTIEFLTVVLFVVHSFEEGWLFFWYGNESINVRNGIYWTNWMDCHELPKLDILNIMQRSDRPIVFWSIFDIPMSAASFTKILYTSYQAFALFRKIT